MSKEPKLDRKELKKPDEFVSRGRKSMQWVFEKKKRFVPVLIVGLTAVAGMYALDWYSDSRLNEAWVSYYEVSKQEGSERWTALETYYNKHSLTRPTVMAAVELGDYYFNEAKKKYFDSIKGDAKAKDSKDKTPPNPMSQKELSTAAVDWYAKALDFGSLLKAERQLLLINRGEAYELDSDWQRAEQDYQAASDIVDHPQGLALLNLARVQELKGDTAAAETTYRRITTDFKDSEYSKLATNHIRRLTSPLFTKGAPPSESE